MCDTFFIRTSNNVIFAKNSDRSANEPNLCLFYPGGGVVETKKCTYISVGQVGPIHSLMLVQPSWMWGGEMGINDQGVVIGNEAVFTKSKRKKQEKLLGMDLLRLALEIASNAKQATEVIIKYLTEYGQGGNAGFDKKFYYDNSYMIADGKEAYILETAGQDWVLKLINTHGNISNSLTIHDDYDNGSQVELDFTKKHTEPVFTFFSKAKQRRACIAQNLDTGDIDVLGAIKILSMHHPDDEQHLYTKGSVRSVCMHQSLLGDHTTGSMIVDYHDSFPTIWLTGSSSPCLSLFKPCFFGIVQPPVFTDAQKSLNYWLEHEYLNRAIFARLINRDEYLAKRDMIQKELVEEEAKLRAKNPTPGELADFMKWCFDKEQKLLQEYQKEMGLVKNQNVKLSKIWSKKAKNLGKNVFETNFDKRNSN